MSNHIFYYYFILILIGLCHLKSIAQAPYMQQYSVEEGLPSSNIYIAFEDSKGFMWFGTDKGLTRFDGYRFEVFDLSGLVGSNEVWEMKEDRDGRIWCATFNKLLYYQNHQFHTVALPPSIDSKMILNYYLNDKGNHFVRMEGVYNFCEIHLEQDSIYTTPFQPLQQIKGIEHLSTFRTAFLKEEQNGTRWFSIKGGGKILIYKQWKNKFELFKIINSSNQASFTNHEPFNLATDNIAFFNNQEVIVFDFKNIHRYPLDSLFDTNITLHRTHISDKINLLKTNNGNQLLTYDFKFLPTDNYLKEMTINTILEDSQGNFWICTPSQGIYFISQKARKSQAFTFEESNSTRQITAMDIDDKEQIWLGWNDGKLNRFANNELFPVELHYEKDITNRVNYPINQIEFDHEGNLFFSHLDGIVVKIEREALQQRKIAPKEKWQYLYKDGTKLLSKQNRLNSKSIWGTVEGSIKNMWLDELQNIYLATSVGVYQVQLQNDIFHFKEWSKERTYTITRQDSLIWTGRKDGLFKSRFDTTFTTQLISDFPQSITHLNVDENDNLWIVAEGAGLFRYHNGQTDTIQEVFKGKEVITDFTIDTKGNIWGASNRGVFKVAINNTTPFSYQFKRFGLNDGLSTLEVNQLLIHKNTIYAATPRGLTIFKEEDSPTIQSPPFHFTDIQINNQSTPLQPNFDLTYNENNITINYACLSYQSLGEITYHYKLEGVDKDWQTTTMPQVVYNTLQPNTYVFKIKAVNHNGHWTKEQQLTFYISPPWWQMIWAYLAYVFLLIGLVYFYYQLQLKKQLAQQEAQQAKALEIWKNELYTNITHEFRTPLTIILGMADKIKTTAKHEFYTTANTIERHSIHLLNLVNQVLDLAKKQEKIQEVQVEEMDLVLFTQYVAEGFYHLAQAKNIQLQFHSNCSDFVTPFNTDTIQTILSNLISNAIKYTDKGGQIRVNLNASSEKIQFTITDTGQGIAQKDLPFIFDRFYKGQNHHIFNSTGIGMAMTKALVQQLNGIIEVDSKVNEGSMFTVTLPVLVAESYSSDAISQSNYPLTNSDNELALPTVLVVEDHPEVANYLNTILKFQYHIQLAKNGLEGIQKALAIMPDIILSDVMMPEMDGYQLCKTLKNDQRTSHIPIILLTAKANKTAKNLGLSTGADAYLTKPFDKSELLIRLKNLREIRQTLHQRYTTLDFIDPRNTSSKVINLEDRFIQKLTEYIVANIDNTALNVAQICKHIGMSRTQLHAKITALTGSSITKFIRRIRLQKAKSLLQTTNLSITEIAYQTGFSNPHFTQVFKKEFQLTPTQYRKNNPQ